MNIVLIGFKKSGKTTIGRILSKLLNKNFVDIDDLIKKFFKEKFNVEKSIFEIFEFLKEKEFRKLECLAFESIKKLDDSVIATSGGCILNKNNLEILKNLKTIIFLKSSKEDLYKRIAQDEKSIFLNKDFFEKEYEKRKNMYESLADIVFEIDNSDFNKQSLKIKEMLNV